MSLERNLQARLGRSIDTGGTSKDEVRAIERVVPIRMVAGLAALAVAAVGFGLWRSLDGREAGHSGPGWVRTEDPSGFAVSHPEGWSVGAESGTVRISGEGAEALVRPFFVQAQLGDDAATAVAVQLAGELHPSVAWGPASVAAPGVARAEGTSTSERAVAILTWAVSDKGTAGQLHVTTAPAGRYAELAPTLARVTGSFALHGAPVDEPAGPTYEPWQDPVEGAFSLEVPQGWLAQGGTVRPSSVLVQASFEATSADGAAVFALGDAYPFFTEPNEVLAYAGIGEGGTYVAPDGYASPVEWYAPGAEFVTRYLLPERAPNAEVTGFVDRPDLAQQLATIGINRYDVGEVEYRFTRDGRPYVGGALAVTELLAGGVGTAWHVWRLYMYEAPEERSSEAIGSLLHAAETFAIDPEWARMQAEITAEQSAIIAEMGEAVSDAIVEGYEGRQATLDALAERRANAMLEVEDVADPLTGETIHVESGSEYYWVDPQGTIVGTDVHAAPDVDFRELVPLDT